MATYIGIDLGTSNSAIATFDGQETRVWKNNSMDVTPSCIYIDKHGRKLYGQRAYQMQAISDDRVAKQFKRFMGTSTKIKFSGEEWTPEECSAEILRELFRCLPEEISKSDDHYTVITVPAAFDQMQNEATKNAAKMANLGKVAVMQEPVAAIMCVVNQKHIKNGTFLIFDMGGGTLDIAIANCINGKVDIIAHGGVAMCGGADIDRKIVDSVIKPWLLNNSEFDIPANFMELPKYQKLLKLARFNAETAKIELSSMEKTTIESNDQISILDENGEEIYYDIPLERSTLNTLMKDIVDEAVDCARQTIEKSGIPASDFERIVFIGGPCNYKPLRDYVTKELGIKSDGLEVNPMTAVAEGAAIYAEGIDWSTVEHARKQSNQTFVDDDLGLKFKYEARTTKDRARFSVMAKPGVEGFIIQIKSVDTGWESGMMGLQNGIPFILPLTKQGDNTFEVYVYDEENRPVSLPQDRIVITKTMSTVGAILASHTVSVEVKESSLNGMTVGDPLIKEGEKLPFKGVKKYKAESMIKAGTDDSLNFNLWEGNISSNIRDNKFIGTFKISGTDLEYGAIRPNEEIEFEYTFNEAQSLSVTVNIERLGITLTQKNFYNPKEAEIDMHSESTVQDIHEQGELLLTRVEDMSHNRVTDDRLDEVERIGQEASSLLDDPHALDDIERVKKNLDNITKAKQLLDLITKDNLKSVRQMQLEHWKNNFNNDVRPYCSESEENEFERIFNNLERAISRKDKSFESTLEELNVKCFGILFTRSKSFVGGFFNYYRERPYNFVSKSAYDKLVNEGMQAISNDDFRKLQQVVAAMFENQKKSAPQADMAAMVNIMKG